MRAEELHGEYISDRRIANVSANVGAVLSDEVGHDFERLLDEADKALYFAKENGKNTHILCHEGICPNGCQDRGAAFAENTDEYETQV